MFDKEEQNFLRCNNKTCINSESAQETLKKELEEKIKQATTKQKEELTQKLDNISFELPDDLKNQLKNKKKTFSLILVKITKDVLSDPVKLFLAAECKSRKKKIQEGYYKVMKMFAGGSRRKKRRNKSRRIKFRRTYSVKYPKG